KTLTRKLRISVPQVVPRHKTALRTDRGPRKVLQVSVPRDGGRPPLVAYWGGISTARRMNAVLDDQPHRVWNDVRAELEQRLLGDTCELCESREGVQVHHIRALKDLR